MRKALIGILLAATAAIPAAAQAQEPQTERQQRAAQRYERLEQRNQQRYEQRQQRQEARTQSSEQAPVARPQRSERAPVVREQRQPRDGGGWRRAPQEQSVPAADWGQRAEREAAERRQAAEAQAQQQQQRQGWGGRGDRSGRDGNWRGRERGPSQTDQAWQGDRNDPRMEEHRRRYERLERQNQREWQRDQRRDERRDWRSDRNDRRWDRTGWRRDNRYDWQRWRYSNRNLYRLPPYYAPYRNYRYSRFSIGLTLDRMFWDRRYWIGNPWQYRLPDPGPGFQWVRYYDDVLLVDTWTGEVVDVIYDFFW